MTAPRAGQLSAAVHRHWRSTTLNPTVHFSTRGVTSLCRKNIRAAWSQHEDAVTCIECRARLSKGDLHWGRPDGGTRMDDIQAEAIVDNASCKDRKRKQWERSVLVDVCHQSALDNEFWRCALLGKPRTLYCERCEEHTDHSAVGECGKCFPDYTEATK